jgi:hypothetical protein
MTDPLQHLAASRSWEWLYELCRPMGLDIQLLDLAQMPVLPSGSRSGAAGALMPDNLRRLRAGVEAAISGGALQVARLASHDVAIVPVRVAGETAGVLLVASPNGGGRGKEALVQVSVWLRTVVERHLGSHAAGPEHLSALHRALEQVVNEGSDRRLVQVFAEAMAMWHDIEVVSYVQTAPGVFVRAVSLAGRRRELPPLVFPTTAVPATLRFSRMPRTQVDVADRDAEGDALVVTLGPTAGTMWLLTLSGGIDACEPALLSGYVSALDLALALATRAASARLALSVAMDLAARDEDPRRALRRALERIRRALGAATASYAVHLVDGSDVVGVTTGSHSEGGRPGQRIRLERRVGPRATAVFELIGEGPSAWTPGEQDASRAVVDVLEQWLDRLGTSPEPEQRSRVAADAMIDEHVRLALERGEAVTVCVFPYVNGDQGAAGRLVAEVRRSLRANDLAAELPTREIVVVLPQTSAPQAASAVHRLRGAVARAAAREGIAIAGAGFATRMPGQDAGSSLMLAARAQIDGRRS